jgi:hypothetical protein
MSLGQVLFQWSKLSHLTELVSLDASLNEVLVQPDRDNIEDWNFIVVDEEFETGFFTSLDYVLLKTSTGDRFNLLTVVKEPDEICESIDIADFDFIGYDLLDKDYNVSALSNCGGFDETFLPADINQYGLIDNFEKVFEVRKRLFENNPDEHHADCNVIAVWRHKIIGRST